MTRFEFKPWILVGSALCIVAVEPANRAFADDKVGYTTTCDQGICIKNWFTFAHDGGPWEFGDEDQKEELRAAYLAGINENMAALFAADEAAQAAGFKNADAQADAEAQAEMDAMAKIQAAAYAVVVAEAKAVKDAAIAAAVQATIVAQNQAAADAAAQAAAQALAEAAAASELNLMYEVDLSAGDIEKIVNGYGLAFLGFSVLQENWYCGMFFEKLTTPQECPERSASASRPPPRNDQHSPLMSEKWSKVLTARSSKTRLLTQPSPLPIPGLPQ